MAPTPSIPELLVGGLARLSSVDWPGELAATVFTQGCPWDCRYCHNPHLLPSTPPAGEAPSIIPWRAVTAFLESRAGLLDGVVFSGGEPLAQAALSSAIAETRSLGFRTALHTSGVAPARLAEALPLLDWVGFDLKAPESAYARVTGVEGSGRRARESLSLLAESGVDFEVRTTVHPDLLGEGDLLELAEEVAGLGVKRWALQPYRVEGSRPGLRAADRAWLTELMPRLSAIANAAELRG